MRDISRRELQSLLAEQPVRLVEISPPEEFRKFHLPCAINVPADHQFDGRIEKTLSDKSQTIVVYSVDADCQAPPRAVRRLMRLGYAHVYHYEAGKVDWQAAGLPIASNSETARG